MTRAPSLVSVSQRSLHRRVVFVLVGIVLLAGRSRADSVTIQKAGDQNSVTYSDVKITNIHGAAIVFTTSSGTSVKTDLSTVTTMTIDDEPQFNQATKDYAANNYTQAVDEFDQTIQSTGKSWLKAYCEPLFTDAANKAGRFDKAVEGFIWLVQNQPDVASVHRPPAPGPDTASLDGIAQSLSDAADASGMSNQQQSMLLGLLLDVDRARNDTQAIDFVASKLKKLSGDSGTPSSDAAGIALADARLTEASNALSGKNFDQAISIITSAANLFADQRRQADALYILAQAHEGQAQTKDNADTWRDAAIAYMRVVANFKDAPGVPHVADSLLATAMILESHLNQGPKAMKLDQDIQSQYAGTHAADEAAKQLARLQAAGVQPD